MEACASIVITASKVNLEIHIFNLFWQLCLKSSETISQEIGIFSMYLDISIKHLMLGLKLALMTVQLPFSYDYIWQGGYVRKIVAFFSERQN